MSSLSSKFRQQLHQFHRRPIIVGSMLAFPREAKSETASIKLQYMFTWIQRIITHYQLDVDRLPCLLFFCVRWRPNCQREQQGQITPSQVADASSRDLCATRESPRKFPRNTDRPIKQNSPCFLLGRFIDVSSSKTARIRLRPSLVCDFFWILVL